MSEKTEISHDKLFRTAFKDNFKGLIELVHPEVAAALDLDQLKFVGEKLFADFRKEGHMRPDLVAETTTLGGDPQLVLVHVEVERGFRSTIDNRVWRYSLHLSLKSNKPVLTVVVFISGGTAGVAVREVVKTVGAFEVSRHRYLAMGLSGSLAEDYVDRPQPLAGALAALMRSKVWDEVKKKVRCLEAIRRADIDDTRRFVLGRIVETYIELDEEEEQRFATEMEMEANKEVREMVVTWEEALAEREARGEARGKLEAAQQAVLISARRRFGRAGRAFEEKVQAIDEIDRLYEVLEQVLEADSLAAIELG